MSWGSEYTGTGVRIWGAGEHAYILLLVAQRSSYSRKTISVRSEMLPNL
jgi:hypothetical protein